MYLILLITRKSGHKPQILHGMSGQNTTGHWTLAFNTSAPNTSCFHFYSH